MIVTPAFFGMHCSSFVYQPWPTVDFSMLRTWDIQPGVSFFRINVASGIYDWAKLDQDVDIALSYGLDIVYTFGYTPQWASTNSGSPDFIAYPPVDSDWVAFVNAVTNRYRGKIKYWELWNEPNSIYTWRGTTAQMVRMAQLAYPIIKANGGTVLSPCPQGPNAYTWLDDYFGAGGDAYTDIVAFHGYVGLPENIIAFTSNLRSVVAKYPSLKNKPLWDTEHSWGDTYSNHNLPLGNNEDEQVAWLARFIILSFLVGIQKSIWYQWGGYDNQRHYGMIYDDTIQRVLKPGVAYGWLYSWLLWGLLESYMKTGEIYQCRLRRHGGYEALILWVANGDPSYMTTYTVPPGFVRYNELDGSTTYTQAGDTLMLGMKPILLEN